MNEYDFGLIFRYGISPSFTQACLKYGYPCYWIDQINVSTSLLNESDNIIKVKY